MKKHIIAAALAAALLVSAPAFAATKTYQVTGPVMAMTDSTITVQKGSEKWEIARGSATAPADVKVGSKVMIEYSMTAEKITDKSAKTAAPASAKKP